MESIFVQKCSLFIDRIYAKFGFRVRIFFGACIMGVIAIVVGVSLANSMASAVDYSSCQIEKVADGVLSFEENKRVINRSDEIGGIANAIRKVMGHLKNVIGHIANTSTELENFTEKYVLSFRAVDEHISNMEEATNEVANGATNQAIAEENAADHSQEMPLADNGETVEIIEE